MTRDFIVLELISGFQLLARKKERKVCLSRSAHACGIGDHYHGDNLQYLLANGKTEVGFPSLNMLVYSVC